MFDRPSSEALETALPAGRAGTSSCRAFAPRFAAVKEGSGGLLLGRSGSFLARFVTGGRAPDTGGNLS
jgi:hypothetical protein